jgi:putative two-component system response regulator
LAAECIPLPARVVALADVYDALTSRRVYKPAMPHAKAAEIIRGDRGKHFDPDVVDAFCAHEGEFERLAIELADPEPTPDAARQDSVSVITA